MNEYLLDRYGRKISIFLSDGEKEVNLYKPCLEFFKKELTNSNNTKNIIKKMLITHSRKVILFKHPIITTKTILNYLLENGLGGIKSLYSKELFARNILPKFLQIYLKLKKEPINVSLHFENKKVHMGVNYFSYIPQLMMILEIWIKDQYDAFKSVKNKIVFDVGANQGVFSIYAAILGARKVYAFEPVPETFKVLQENIRLNKLEDKIIPIQAGVGDKEQESIIYYDRVGDMGASFCESPGKMNKIKVKIVTIDEFVKKEKIPHVDFIKIDTEGFEKEVLLGAKETIREWKPILSLSAYHRPEDKETLPKVIKSIRSDYNIKLNRYGDEDFYCY